MRFRLDPTAPQGISPVTESKRTGRQPTGYVVNKVTGLIQAGNNVTLAGSGTQSDPYVVSSTAIGGGGGGSGITRSITTVTTTLTGGATALTDYVYLLSTGATYTQPTAVGNTSRYTLKNISASNKTVSFTSAQTADGSTSLTLTPNTSLDLISDNANWRII